MLGWKGSRLSRASGTHACLAAGRAPAATVAFDVTTHALLAAPTARAGAGPQANALRGAQMVVLSPGCLASPCP